MRLNGWQRIFCVFLIPFWAYLAITLYAEKGTTDNEIQHLEHRIEELKSNPDTLYPPGFNREQTISNLQLTLDEQQDSFVHAVILVVFVALVPPAIFYFTTVWIIAGFRIKDKETA